jgi:hypothetical protein
MSVLQDMVNFVEETEEAYVVPFAEGQPAASLVMVALGVVVDVREEGGVETEAEVDAEEKTGIKVATGVDPAASEVDVGEVGEF